jgi:mono/diheme cytochrome c family protein
LLARTNGQERQLTAHESTHRWLPWIGCAAAVAVTIALMLVVISLAPSRDAITEPSAADADAKSAAAARSPGVQASIRAGAIAITRTLPALSLALRSDQTLDMRLPPGPFHGEFDATFRVDKGTRARFGAEIEGGSVEIIWRGEVVAASDAERDASAPVMSDLLAVPARLNTVTYRYTSTGGGPARLRAVWQPQDAQTPLPLPASGSPLLESDSVRGRMLFEKLNCVACHAPQAEDLRTTIATTPAPNLGEIGSRARPAWISAWISNPHALKHDRAMPRLFPDDPAHAETIENLVHFLVSMGGPLHEPASAVDATLALTGHALFHTIGCFACHGSHEDANGSAVAGEAEAAISSLGDLRAKSTAPALAAFLRDPLAIRPSGRMPSLELREEEAHAIAHYLISLGSDDADSASAFTLDPSRVEAGQASFASLGCAACHALGANRSPIESTLDSPGLESIASSIQSGELAGCLADDWQPGTPRFALESNERRALAAFLRQIHDRRSVDVPHDRLASALSRLNCLACHRYQSEGGPDSRLARHFTTLGDADLGDEGRLPPPLTEVGAKLNVAWLHDVLMNRGRVRPYVAVRMPHFGEAARDLAPWFGAACGAGAPSVEPAFTDELADAGRTLVGSAGLNCLQCHSIAGRAGTGTTGVDLANTVERLRFDYFDRWLHDPSRLSPGTRMPTFFVDGVSGITETLDGDSRRQIDAIWCYLSQGEMLPLPEGILDPSSLQLEVVGEPMVFRTFMKEAGVRAIACGYPEQIHCAFDSDSCALTAVWEGAYINASGAWAGRGGTETNPAAMAWTAARRPIVGQCDVAPFTPAAIQFDGYRFDERRRPVFLYRATLGAGVLHVEHQPIPQRMAKKASLLNRMTFKGPPGMRFCVATPIVAGDLQSMQLDESGAARLEWEITW